MLALWHLYLGFQKDYSNMKFYFPPHRSDRNNTFLQLSYLPLFQFDLPLEYIAICQGGIDGEVGPSK